MIKIVTDAIDKNHSKYCFIPVIDRKKFKLFYVKYINIISQLKSKKKKIRIMQRELKELNSNFNKLSFDEPNGSPQHLLNPNIKNMLSPIPVFSYSPPSSHSTDKDRINLKSIDLFGDDNHDDSFSCIDPNENVRTSNEENMKLQINELKSLIELARESSHLLKLELDVEKKTNQINKQEIEQAKEFFMKNLNMVYRNDKELPQPQPHTSDESLQVLISAYSKAFSTVMFMFFAFCFFIITI